MNKFEDIFESKIEIEESKSKSKNDQVLATIKFPWAKAEIENLNKRFYPFAVLQNATTKLSEKIKQAYVPGQTDHPLMGGGTRLSDVSHILKSVWMKDKVAYAEADILKTSRGSDVLRVIKSGISMGASLRGFGEMDSSGRVKPGLEVASVDLVANPSFGKDTQVGVSNIVIESTILEPGSGELSLSEKQMAGVYHKRPPKGWGEKVEGRTETDRKFFLEAVIAGFEGTFEEWKKGRE